MKLKPRLQIPGRDNPVKKSLQEYQIPEQDSEQPLLTCYKDENNGDEQMIASSEL